jgi:thiamine biosynthesis lipoprotein
LIVLALLGTAAFGAASEPARWEFTEVHMGLPVRIVLYAGGEPHARSAAGAAFARIAALDRLLSDYRPDSELNLVNDRAGDWAPVTSELLVVLDKARTLAEATGGAFDPTIGPLVELWRQARREGRLPDASALEAARARVGWAHLRLDRARRAARLDRAGMRLDLGGLAKGFILDEARATLRAAGVTRVLLEAGGDIVVGEAPPGERGWRVDVPGTDAGFASRAAVLANAALSTSGPTAQFVEIEGVRYSHVVDPRTGAGLTRDAVTHVIASDGATADALATAIGVLGLSCAKDVIVRFPGASVAEVGVPAGPCGAVPVPVR